MRAVVIDDSKTQALRLAATLERHGFTTEVAFDGEAGVRACAAAPPDVVLSDVLMPGVDGYEVCRRLKSSASTRDIPVMLLTSLADPMDVVRALAAGADNFVTKPYEDEQLIARVERMVRGRHCTDSIVEVHGETFRIDAPPARILDVLVSSLEDAAARNAELEASRQRLARANAQRDDLMAIVAHELKTPLAALSMRAELALRKASSNGPSVDDFRALASSTTKQVGRLVAIIDDLSDITRIESGGLRIEKKRVNLVEVAREALERQRTSSTIHHLAMSAPEALYVEADPLRVDQVITNFLTNALKYAPNGGEVGLRLAVSDGSARVSVSDEGIGIAPEAMPRLFERYFRTSGGRSTAQGLGLGLYVSKQLVELHGGKIGAESRPGEGSTFWFTLPLASR